MDELTPTNLPEPPSDDNSEPTVDECRLWIGNVDTRVTEFALLKVLQKHGTLKKFDFLYHKSGPDQGKPRGYCFATYSTKEEAQRALKKLNGKLALSKKLLVKPAHAEKKEESSSLKPINSMAAEPGTIISGSMGSGASTKTKIQAIEAKLRQLEKSPESSARQPVWQYDPDANKPVAKKPLKKPYERPRQRRR